MMQDLHSATSVDLDLVRRFPLRLTAFSDYSQLFRRQILLLYSPLCLPPLIIATGSLCALNDLFRQLQRVPQAAGGYRPHRRRLRQAEEGRRAKLFRTMSLPPREDAVVLGACHASVFSLLRLRRVWRRLHLHPEGREHNLPRSRPPDRAEARRAHAEADFLQSGGSARRPHSHGAPRCACARHPVFSGVSAPPRGRECPRIPQRPRPRCGDDRPFSHRLRARFRLRDALRREFDEELLRESGLFSWKESSQPSALSSQETLTLRSPQDHNLVGSPETKGERRTANSESFEPRAKSQEPKAAPAIYSKFRNRVMFPIANEQGKVIAFTGRTLSADEQAGTKYLNSPETPIYSKSRVLFNLDNAKEWIRKLDYSILVEGQMDCISVYAAGFHNVIASSGTAFTEPQAKLLGRFSKNVVVNFDPDTAGARATERTLGLLVEEEFHVKILSLEPGFDPDLYIRRKGKDAYADALKHSQEYFDYLIERARAQFPVRSGEGKKNAVNYLLPYIQRIPSRIVRDELAHE